MLRSQCDAFNDEIPPFNGYLLIDKWLAVICARTGRPVNPPLMAANKEAIFAGMTCAHLLLDKRVCRHARQEGLTALQNTRTGINL